MVSNRDRDRCVRCGVFREVHIYEDHDFVEVRVHQPPKLMSSALVGVLVVAALIVASYVLGRR